MKNGGIGFGGVLMDFVMTGGDAFMVTERNGFDLKKKVDLQEMSSWETHCMCVCVLACERHRERERK